MLAVTEGDEIVIHVDGEVQLPVVIDPSLVDGTVYVPFNLAGTALRYAHYCLIFNSTLNRFKEGR